MSWWGIGIGVVGSVASSAISSNAADNAADGQAASERDRIAEQKREYDLYREDQKPYKDTGYAALSELSRLLGLSGDAKSAGFGSLNKTFTGDSLANDPGYQFRLKQGQDLQENSAAVRGGLFSGAEGKALQEYGQGFASNEFQNAWNRNKSDKADLFNRYSGLAGTGQIATQQVGQAGQNYANQYGDAVTGAANARAAAGIAQGNLFGGAVNQGLAAYGRGGFGGNGGSEYTSPNFFGNYSNPGGDTYAYTDIYGSAGDYSDPALKTEVERIGTRPDGLGVFVFRYLWGGPKRVGLMADEVESLYPHAVSRDPVGFRKVDYSKVPEWQPI